MMNKKVSRKGGYGMVTSVPKSDLFLEAKGSERPQAMKQQRQQRTVATMIGRHLVVVVVVLLAGVVVVLAGVEGMINTANAGNTSNTSIPRRTTTK